MTQAETGTFVDFPAETDDGLLHRSYDAEFTAGDGRTVDVRIVPYGETATAHDGHGGVARGIPYEEEWMPGVFAHQMNAANRVYANFEHQQGISGIVGHGLTLRESSDGFYGSFKLHETPDGDKALMLVKEDVLGGVSLEARPVRNIRTATGVVRRVKAHLHAIALCRTPAYKSAQVLAVRQQEVFIDENDPDLNVSPLDPELVARCQRLGIKLPQHLAHPAESGTPDESGTPADGTRQDTETS